MVIYSKGLLCFVAYLAWRVCRERPRFLNRPEQQDSDRFVWNKNKKNKTKLKINKNRKASLNSENRCTDAKEIEQKVMTSLYSLNDSIFHVDVGIERIVIVHDFTAFDQKSILGALKQNIDI